MKQTTPLVLLAALGCSTPPSQESDSAQELTKALNLLDQKNWDEALMVTDAVLSREPNNRRAHLLAARGNVGLFESGRDGAQYFLKDAIENYQDALALDANDAHAWTVLAELELKDANFDGGRDAAKQAITLLNEASQNTNDPAGQRTKRARALLALADNEMQVFVDLRRPELAAEEKPSDDTIEAATTTLTTLDLAFRDGAVAGATTRSAQVYQWLGKNSQALQILERGLETAPDDAELHQAFLQLYRGMGQNRECLAAYRRLLAANQGSTLLLWYYGQAQVSHADDLRGRSQWEPADEAYAAAAETFRGYAEKQPNHSESAGQWRAIVAMSRARIAYETGDLDEAKRRFYSAYDASPLVAEYDANNYPRIYDSFGGNYAGGLFLIGTALTEQDDGLRKSLAFYEEVLERHPGKFGALYNNAALSARDLGVAISRPADEEGSTLGEAEKERLRTEAMGLWEKSYRYYEQAVELEPNDERIVNDCGLMLVYHLHRDYDRAREMFERAIEIGQPKLDALPDDAPEAQRNDISEAVGDAWQNIAVLLRQLDKPYEEWAPFAKKSVEYYPWQQRTAALMLRQAESGTDANAPDPREPQFAAALPAIEAKAAEQDFDGALLALDGIAKQFDGYAPYHFRAGLYSLRLAEQQAANGGDAGLVDGLFNDAKRQLERSVSLDGESVEPRIELAKAQVAVGDFAQARDLTNGLLSHMRALGVAEATSTRPVHRLRAQASSRVFVASVQAEGRDDEALRELRTSFRELETADDLDASLRDLWITTEQWAGATAQARGIVERALEQSPEDYALNQKLIDLATTTEDLTAVATVLDARDDAIGSFYLGMARYRLGQSQWGDGSLDAALASLDGAVRAFRMSMAKNDGFAESCLDWIGLTRGTKANVLIAADRLEDAQKELVATLLDRPALFQSDLGGGVTMKRTVLVLGDRYYQAGDLGKTEALYRSIVDAIPDDVDLLNNLGLFARDYGVEVERGGDADAAKRFYENSYAAYTRAADLDPRNVRLRNDRALLLIYHLHRELDVARDLLVEAIAEGTKRLQDEPPTDETALQNLQEAVGDCHENLGYYHMTVTEDNAAARKEFEASLSYYPFERRASTGHLRRLDQDGGDK